MTKHPKYLWPGQTQQNHILEIQQMVHLRASKRNDIVTCYILITWSTVLPAKSDSDVIFCLQSYQGLIIDRSLLY